MSDRQQIEAVILAHELALNNAFTANRKLQHELSMTQASEMQAKEFARIALTLLRDHGTEEQREMLRGQMAEAKTRDWKAEVGQQAAKELAKSQRLVKMDLRDARGHLLEQLDANEQKTIEAAQQAQRQQQQQQQQAPVDAASVLLPTPKRIDQVVDSHDVAALSLSPRFRSRSRSKPSPRETDSEEITPKKKKVGGSSRRGSRARQRLNQRPAMRDAAAATSGSRKSRSGPLSANSESASESEGSNAKEPTGNKKKECSQCWGVDLPLKKVILTFLGETEKRYVCSSCMDTLKADKQRAALADSSRSSESVGGIGDSGTLTPLSASGPHEQCSECKNFDHPVQRVILTFMGEDQGRDVCSVCMDTFRAEKARREGSRKGSSSSSRREKSKGTPKMSKKNVDVFHDSLETIMAYQKNIYPNLRVPCLLNFLTEETIRLGGFKSEGIFRISVEATHIAGLVKQISKAKKYGNYKLKQQHKDPNLPAAMMKQWLRDLPVPVFMEYNQCLKVGETSDREGYLRLLLNMIPTHREVALYVCDFLADVADEANVELTKMGVENLARVFVPSFLRCSSKDPRVIMENNPKEMAFVKHLIEFAGDLAFQKELRDRL